MTSGKIVKALAGFYYVKDGDKIVECRGRGVLRKHEITPLVGDYVVYRVENDHLGYIMEVGERKNELVRPPIVNVDQALLVFSAVEPDFNPKLLNRFLTVIEFHGVKPIICISKMDLLPDDVRPEVEAYLADYAQIGYDIVRTSIHDKESVEQLYPFFKDKITVIAGQTGVGKSSLLNVMRPELNLETNEISQALGRGKHTTRHVELFEVAGGLVSDTPGFSALDFDNIEVEDLSDCFLEIKEASQRCKFRSCLHLAEPKCAVKDAVEAGEIKQYRYDDYVAYVEEIRERKPRY